MNTTSEGGEAQLQRRLGVIDAVAAMVRFCGLTILPTTPPEVLAATSNVGSRPALVAAACCNNALALVSDPVTAVPSQPSTGERNAKKAPAPAIHVPMVMVWPDWFITYARASTEATVRMEYFILTRLRPWMPAASVSFSRLASYLSNEPHLPDRSLLWRPSAHPQPQSVSAT